MDIKAPFFLRNTWSKSTLDLLKNTVFGTNGARYQHLDTEQIIQDVDNPLFLSLERNDTVLANITICQRERNWYIRYFSFQNTFHSTKTAKTNKNSRLKSLLTDFFDESLKRENDCFYAYLEPKNERSKQMCENFGFEVIGNLKTHSFSRLQPKTNKKLLEINDSEEINFLNSQFEKQQFYSSFHPKRTKIYAFKNDLGEIICSARIQKANWRIECLPGKFGKILVKIMPFIPLLNKFINPKDYKFLVPDMVFCKDSKPAELELLFEAILAQENHKLLLWWIDQKDPLNKLEKQISWGIFKKILGNPLVNVIAKYNPEKKPDKENIFFVSGIDLI